MKWLGVLLLPSPPWMGCWSIPRVPPQHFTRLPKQFANYSWTFQESLIKTCLQKIKKFLHNLDKSSLISTQYIRPFSVVQEGSYKVRKKGMQTNLTDFFSSFRKAFSRFFFKTRIRGKGRFLPKPAQPNLYCKGNKPITKNHTVMFTYWKVADDDSDQLKDKEQIFWVLWQIETNFIMYEKFNEFNTTNDIIINVTTYS